MAMIECECLECDCRIQVIDKKPVCISCLAGEHDDETFDLKRPDEEEPDIW